MKRLFSLVRGFELSSMTMSIMILLLALFVFVGSNSASAAIFEVNSTMDVADDNPGDGICDDGSGKCTLRAAIMEANDLAGPDEIVLKSKKYVISVAGADQVAAVGDFDIRDDLLIQGQGTSKTVVDCDFLTRAFELRDDNALNVLNVEIYDLKIKNCVASNAGGAIRNSEEKLRLERVIIENNNAPRGAGLFNGTGADATILHSVFYLNITFGDPGMERGGAIYNDGELFIGNSTVSNNGAENIGGGIFNKGSIHAPFTTIAENWTNGTTGGVHLTAGSDISFYGTIIANNIGADCGGFINKFESLGFNISTSDCNLDDPTDMPNTDPMLGPIKDNGGDTLTHALLDGSPAIDMAGNEFGCFEASSDQRGISRPQDGDQVGGAHCDAGAFELIVKAVSEGDSGGGCSVANPGAAPSLPLYLLVPVFLLVIRLIRKCQIDA